MAPRNQTLRQDIQSILLDWRSQNVRPIHTHTKTNNLTYYYYHPKRGEKRNENIETKKGGKKEILFGRLITFQTTSTRSLLERELRLYPL
jgi:hypothetical protein